MVQGIRLREEPSRSARILRVLSQGQTMDVLEQEQAIGLWYRVRVRTSEGIEFGWVRSDTVEEIEPERPCPSVP